MSLIKSEISETKILIQDKKFAYAESRASLLLNKQPGNPKVYELMGDVYFNQNLYKKSVWYYLDACQKNQQDKDILYKLGENIYYLKYYEIAEALMRKVIEKDPLYTQAYITLGLTQQETDNTEDAIMCYEDAININPKEVFAYLNLALLHKKNKNFDEAVKVYQKAIINNPNNHFILSNLGNLFYLQKKYDDAILCHERSVKIKPDSEIAHYNFANTLFHSGHFERAKEVYSDTLKISPSFNRASANLGALNLLTENFKEGFDYYHSRIFNDPSLKTILNKKKTIWKGEPLDGKRILVCSETGYGNIIQFSRYIPLLKQLNCEIVFSCPIEIQHLFENISEIDEFILPDQNYNDFYCWIPLLDLPKVLAPNILQECPQPTDIKINDDKLLEWEMLLGIDQKVKIGLCWQGDPNNPRDHLNSVNLTMFKDVLNIPNTSFISLQKGFARNQIQKNEYEKQIIDYDPLIDQGSNKFLDTSAILKYLDLVITTDTSIAHLAGSLGTQTWVLLPQVPDWRWFLEKEDSIWYDNMRLFRQKNNNWEEVFNNLKSECETLVSNISEIRKENEAN